MRTVQYNAFTRWQTKIEIESCDGSHTAYNSKYSSAQYLLNVKEQLVKSQTLYLCKKKYSIHNLEWNVRLISDKTHSGGHFSTLRDFTVAHIC